MVTWTTRTSYNSLTGSVMFATDYKYRRQLPEKKNIERFEKNIECPSENICTAV